MLDVIDRQRLKNGFSIITYKTYYCDFLVIVSVKSNDIIEESRVQLEKMAWKIERNIRNKKAGDFYTGYVIRCYSKNAYSWLLEELGDLPSCKAC